MPATSPRRVASRVPGAKILITASALAAALAGWASLAWKAATDTASAAPSVVQVEAQLAAAGVVLQPIPTLVPAPTESLASSVQASQQASLRPVLRSVSAPPPAPVTQTRSSRR